VLVGAFGFGHVVWNAAVFRTVAVRHWGSTKWLTPSALMQWTTGNLFIMAAGALLGWEKILVVIFLSALIGALTGVMGLALKKLTFLSRIPFGPFLAMGTIAVIFFGDEIISLYLSTMIVKK
ncbi:MAG: prepilin peptidase, partial [Nitrospinae bacterium]|nr:prepilin peptidase [Nitrospinota bacterium]